jgi:hypothetical protein
MPDANLNIIVTAVDRASAVLNKSTTAFGKWKGQIADVAKAIPGVGNALVLLTNPLTLATAGIAGIGKVLRDSVKETYDYALQVDDLSRKLGTNTEEASKLIQIGDDLRVSVGTLETSFRYALKNGITPNIEGLIELSGEYQKLKTPADKAAFAMDKFGRAGLEMQKILEKTPDQLQEMSKALDGSALVMSQKAVQAAKDYYAAMDALNDKSMEVKISIGNKLIPVITDAIEVFDEGTTAGFNIAEELGIIADLITDRLYPNFKKLIDPLMQVNSNMSAGMGDLRAYESGLNDVAGAAGGAAEQIGNVQYSIMELSETTLAREAIDALNKAIAQDPENKEKYRAQIAMIMTQWLDMPASEVIAAMALQDLEQQAEDGKITYAELYDQVVKTNDYLTSQNGKHYTTYYDVVTTGTNYHYTPPTGGGITVPQSPVSSRPEFRANGGPAIAGNPYIVGERGPEVFVPRQSGRVESSTAAPFDYRRLGKEIGRAVRDAVQLSQ